MAEIRLFVINREFKNYLALNISVDDNSLCNNLTDMVLRIWLKTYDKYMLIFTAILKSAKKYSFCCTSLYFLIINAIHGYVCITFFGTLQHFFKNLFVTMFHFIKSVFPQVANFLAFFIRAGFLSAFQNMLYICQNFQKMYESL